jgi:hypothetical protein
VRAAGIEEEEEEEEAAAAAAASHAILEIWIHSNLTPLL